MSAIRTIAAGQEHADGLLIGLVATDKLAFNGTAPIVQPAGASQAICTDAASVIVLANALRLSLVNLGLIKGAA